MKVALAQLNLPVGDIEGNTDRIIDSIERATGAGAQVLALPELAITGYPPEDLILKRSFVSANQEAVAKIAARTNEMVVVVGFVEPDAVGKVHYNSAAICQNGDVIAVYRKQLLPNYGVFDEDRYFEPGSDHHLLATQHGVIGVCICEDAWSPSGPLISQGDAGAQLVVNINASPFHKGKLYERERMLGERARHASTAIAYVNMVGGQDELVFDGASMVLDAQGEIVARLPQFEEAFEVVDVPLGKEGTTTSTSVTRHDVVLRDGTGEHPPVLVAPYEGPAEVYQALVLALRDYVRKNGFSKVVLGLSGGIDSALTATIAADALGPDNVLGVMMPSSFSSGHSVSDSEELAANIGIQTVTIPIARAYDVYLEMLADVYGEVEMGVAEENLQARIRGNLIMAISNRYGHLVVATGNKSEMAVGYATLYGDMAGGFALLKDVFKTEVYELARYRNEKAVAIPPNIISKAPSAELRHDQTDQDSLPPYDVLDGILDLYVEEDAGRQEIEARGYAAATIDKVLKLVDRAEYKRRQSAPGPKVSTKNFGRDRRLPITNRWRESY